MAIGNKKEPLLLLLGDLVLLVLSLYLTLVFRYGSEFNYLIWISHIEPFAYLFLAWVFSFFVAGLYEKHTVIFKSRLPSIIFNTQIVNSIIAVLFFYFIPYFGITPKTNLFVYLVTSFILIAVWRLYVFPNLGSDRKQKGLLISSGKELRELYDEVNNNKKYGLEFVSYIDLDKVDAIDFNEDILREVYEKEVSIIAADINDGKVGPLLPHLYNLIFSKIHFIQTHKVYEDIFDRVPLSLLRYNWFLENISLSPHTFFDAMKRVMDICISLVLGILSLVLYPFVWIAIKLDDGGPVFIMQERIGQNGKITRAYKFRSMSRNELDLSKGAENKVTRVGKFLRNTRIDELPQLWSVIKGDISLIGPRPEVPSGVNYYKDQVPFYNVRHLIKPGLTGWAQMYHEKHPHHGFDVEETKNKLSYDLYYIKNRSFILDLKIALRTIKTLLSREGR
jgi:exopolysaccharide biosynthesis polyprenyl glycosylphosphotransferase